MNKIQTLFLCVILVFGSVYQTKAQSKQNPPKLVISVVVDQLREDYLHHFAGTFGDRGFRRLLSEGLVYHSVEYGYPNMSISASMATIYTGAFPYFHGITSDKKYDFETRLEQPILNDPDYIGNYTADRYSPLALQSSTLGDELKLASEGRSDVFSIAFDPQSAIISGGRYADAAFWLDDFNGKWANTTFYRNVPWYVDRYNTVQSMTAKEDKIWTPAIASYNGFPYSKTVVPFKHTISKNDGNRFIKLKQTPFINSEITNFAATFFEYADFGKRTSPDFLAITYYAGNYLYGTTTDEFGWEIQDIYYRLDREIERLLDMVEKKVGLKNVLVMLTSTGYYDSAAELPSGFNPAGRFWPARCTALLNVYLMALYGQGNWVKGYYHEQIYLNRQLIADSQLDYYDVVMKAARFLAQFTGVQDVTTSEQWFIDDIGHAAEVRRGIYRSTAGDIFIELKPGWILAYEKNEDRYGVEEIKYRRNTAISVPLIFWGYNLKPQNVYRKILATEIAPSISHILRIKNPNACKENVLEEIITSSY